MAAASHLSLLLLMLSFAAAAVAGSLPAIQQACKATRFPATCINTLSKPGRVPQDPTPIQIIQAAITLSSANVAVSRSRVKRIFDSSFGNPNRTIAAKNCGVGLTNAVYRTALSLRELQLRRGDTRNVRAWMSASLHYQYGCWSGLSYVNDTKEVVDTMLYLNATIGLTSNALCMITALDLYGQNTAAWGPPKTERDGVWGTGSSAAGGSGSGFKGGVPAELTADATVCQGRAGRRCYKTVQAAVEAAPSFGKKRFVIHIPAGTYEEMVTIPLEKRYVVFLGDGVGKTVITGSAAVGKPGISTFNTATVSVIGDGFMMRGVTVQNTAGPVTRQAVAFRSDSDQSVIEECEFLGNQDTLYVQTLRQYYKSCSIQGNIDFIFGNAAAVFEDCTILLRPRQQMPESGESNSVTAQGRVDPAQATGLVFHNCRINATDAYMELYTKNSKVHRNYLGRPWKEFSRTVFLHCYLGPIIAPQGWLAWGGDFALKTLFYGEFGNSGPGADRSQRVEWSSLIPEDHVNAYSVANFIQGNHWIPTYSS